MALNGSRMCHLGATSLIWEPFGAIWKPCAPYEPWEVWGVKWMLCAPYCVSYGRHMSLFVSQMHQIGAV
jgi:hypothetical protein